MRARETGQGTTDVIPDPSRPMAPEHRALWQRLMELAKRYPGSHLDPIKDKAWPVWLRMAEDKRQRAARNLPGFIRMLEGPKGGKPRRRPFLHEYLGEDKFDMVEAADEGRTASSEALKAKLVQRFTQPWWWLWFDLLMRAWREGGSRWPAAQALLERETGKAETTNLAWIVDPEKRAAIDTAASGMVQLGRDSPEALAWADWCRLGGPGVRMPIPDVAPFIWVPSQWPPDADRRTFNDDDRGVEL
jgi:hypothetical protein